MTQTPISPAVLLWLMPWVASAQGAAQLSGKVIDIGAEHAPLSNQARVDLAKAVKAHDYKAEKAVLEKAIEANPMSPELLIVLGRVAFLERQPKDAADSLRRADQIKPLDETDRLTMALAYEFSGRLSESRAELLKLTKAAPKNAQYFYLLGRVDRRNHRLEDAVGEFQKSVELNPNALETYEYLGQTQEDLGLLEKAQKTYEEAARRNRLGPHPTEWPPLDLGLFLAQAGETEQAEKLIEEALQNNQRSPWAHYYLGTILQKKGMDSEAVEEFRVAVVHDPKIRQAWLALGRSYTRLGKAEDAAKAFAIFKKLNDQQNPAEPKK